MTYHLYKIKFLTPLLLGDSKNNNVVLHSDTLFSALYDESLKLGKEIDKDSIILSSCFPYKNNNLLLPKPFAPINFGTDDKKKIKNSSYVNLDFDIGNWECFKINVRTNCALPRDKTKDNKLHYTTAIHFANDCGLWFLCNREIDNVLKSVGWGGIGGDRSSGLGKFEVEKCPMDNDLQELLSSDTKYKMSLSVVSPSESDFANNFENSYYKLITRNSWFQTIKNKDLNMLGEGSCFDFDLKGEIKDVSINGEHPIFKYGKNISIGIPDTKISKEKQ